MTTGQWNCEKCGAVVCEHMSLEAFKAALHNVLHGPVVETYGDDVFAAIDADIAAAKARKRREKRRKR